MPLPRLGAMLLLWFIAAAPLPQATPDAPLPGRAWLGQQTALCDAAIAAAETEFALPPHLLGSIAKVESGRPISGMSDIRAWPWTIDADGQGLFLDSRAAAVAWAQQALTRGARFMDLGCMQVDWQIHPGAFRSLDEAFDPAANARYAAHYLRSLHDEAHGDWNLAVGWYHSHTEDLAADYRNRVAAVGAGILTGIGGPEPLYRRAMRQGTLRLAMAGGGVLLINVHRQPRSRPGRGLTRCQLAAALRPLLAAGVRGCPGRG